MRSHQVGQHLIQYDPENLQGGEIHNLPGQPPPLLDCLRKCFLLSSEYTLLWLCGFFSFFVYVCCCLVLDLVGWLIGHFLGF